MTDSQNIRRRPDGSIDHEHYDRVACGLRAHDQRAVLSGLAPSIARLLRILSSRPSARIRAFFGS